jgi:hypothetical protein
MSPELHCFIFVEIFGVKHYKMVTPHKKICRGAPALRGDKELRFFHKVKGGKDSEAVQ